MDIEEIKKEKQILEDKIFKLLTDFSDKTTIIPDDVNLDILYVTTYDNPNKKIVQGVQVEATI